MPAVVAGLPWCFTIIAEISCACKFCAPAFVIFRTLLVFDSGVYVNCMCMHALFLYAAKWCAFKKTYEIFEIKSRTKNTVVTARGPF